MPTKRLRNDPLTMAPGTRWALQLALAALIAVVAIAAPYGAHKYLKAKQQPAPTALEEEL